MAQQNIPNGIPPQMANQRPPINTNMEKPPLQFNGFHSSHSSRDSSPSTRPGQQVPPSQLPPPRQAIPSSQLPPSRSPINLPQKMSQLNVKESRFDTSSPNQGAQTLQNTSGLFSSAFSPINPKTDSAPNQVFKSQGNNSPFNLQSQNRVPQNQTEPPNNYNQNFQPKPLLNNQATPQLPTLQKPAQNAAPQNSYFNSMPPNNIPPKVIPSNPIPNQPNRNNLPSVKQNMPPPPNHNMPPALNHNMPNAPNHNMPSAPNHNMPPALNHNMPPAPNHNMPSAPNYNMPPAPNHNMPPAPNYNMPPAPNHNMPPAPNQHMPPAPNHNMPRAPNHNMPPAPNHNMPPIPNQKVPPLLNQNMLPTLNHNMSPIPNQSIPSFLNHNMPLVQNQKITSPPTQNIPLTPSHNIPPVSNQNMPSNPNQNMPPVSSYRPTPVINQYGPILNHNMPPAPSGQVKTNFHANRYPQASQPSQQPAFYQQQASQQSNVTQHGFNKLWGHEHLDLLQTPNILPKEKVTAPKIYLGNEILDSANCSPDVFRCTMTKIPESNALLQKSRLPLGILIHPFKDLTHLPVIQCNVIVRCRACRTYINPFVMFVDTKRWKCNLCYRVNELPEEFQFDPVSKTYGDPSRRPEIKSSTIEYIAPAEYMLRPPQPAVYLFLFDISRLAIESGYLQSACAVLLEDLKNLPGDARTQVGIVAYDSALHFFALGEGLNQPHEMTVLEIDDVFLPCPDNLLVNLKDRVELLTDLLTQLPTRYNNNYDNNSALGAALQAAHKMMGVTGGRVTVFQASLPNVGPGALTPREDPSQRASIEVTHLNPANDFYKRLALECSGQQIAVDLFIVNSQYVDVATISGISRFSGGCLHHFPLFKASRVLQNERFERCFKRYLTRKIGFEAVMRIRCTRGLSIHTFHGNFFVRSTDLLSLPNVSPDSGFGMQVSIDESLSDVQSVCFQAALLYTSSKGERRIRVHTLCLPICATLSDVIHAADQQCIMGLLAKMAVDRSMQSSLSDAREAFINVAIDILSSYKLCINMGNGSSSLFAPTCLQLLPLYISALLKSTAFRTGTCTRLDDRVKSMIDMKTKPLSHLIQMIYPDLYPIHNLEEVPVILNSEDEPVPQPPHLQLTARCLDSKGAFLMDTGDHMIMLICPGVSSVFLNEALGVRDYISITDEMYELPILDNLHNQRLHQFISYLNDEKPYAATLHVIRDNSPIRIEFFEKLIEDRLENALSYHEFMQHLKSQIK